jgi:DNA-binding CsgD family transcriptional regulator
VKWSLVEFPNTIYINILITEIRKLDFMDVKNNIFISSSNDVAQIVKPLKDFMGIEQFSLRRIYSDQSRLYLCSNVEWVEHSFKKQYLKRGRFHQLVIQQKLKYVLWDYWPETDILFSEMLEDFRENFGRGHGLSILKPHDNYTDVFTFTAKKSNENINNLYFNNIIHLEKFIDYFVGKFSSVIKKAAGQRMCFSEINKEDLSSSNEGGRQEHLNVDQFYKDIQNNMIPLLEKEKKEIFDVTRKAPFLLALSPRQQECFFYLIRGYTAKQIAQKLGCSPRTIETHMDHIRNKLKCPNKGQLIELAFENGLFETNLTNGRNYIYEKHNG